MTNRTVRILGQGFGNEPASISVTLAGVEIFSGNVNTLPLSDIPSLPNLDLVNSTVILMSFDVPVTYTGTQAMTCSVTSGVVIFAQIVANYSPIINPIYTAEDLEILGNPASTSAEKLAVISPLAVPTLTSEEILLLESTDPIDESAQEAILASHGLSTYISGGSEFYQDVDLGTDPRDNVTINGVAVTPDRSTLPGTQWFEINSGQILAYDLTINAGLE